MVEEVGAPPARKGPCYTSFWIWGRWYPFKYLFGRGQAGSFKVLKLIPVRVVLGVGGQSRFRLAVVPKVPPGSVLLPALAPWGVSRPKALSP